MTIVNLHGQKLDLVSNCCQTDIIVRSNVAHIYFCKKCGNECGVHVSNKDIRSKDKK